MVPSYQRFEWIFEEVCCVERTKERRREGEKDRLLYVFVGAKGAALKWCQRILEIPDSTHTSRLMIVLESGRILPLPNKSSKARQQSFGGQVEKQHIKLLLSCFFPPEHRHTRHSF
jgi:hypothetical protein